MKVNWKKVIEIFLIIVSVINIVCTILGFIISKVPNTEEGTTLLYIPLTVIIVVVLQILNIKLLYRILKQGTDVDKKEFAKKIIISIIIIIITTFVPIVVEETRWINQPGKEVSNSDESSDENSMIENIVGSIGTDNVKSVYKNIYGITIYENEQILLHED